MTEEKRNRLIAAITVNVILLIVVLAAVCIYQLVTIVTLKSFARDLQQQIQYYDTEKEKLDHTLDYYKSEEGLFDLAYKYGFVFGK